ncbi:MAG: hypothetical protein CM1200mP41_21270 [Gammaproteobacteria bacterium]|nr:MAG: hypothetical protein CM1200mP41_21270 [Gammaproteobacteria bacterium]
MRFSKRREVKLLGCLQGNKDVLELARGRMPSPYNFLLPRDEPLIPRDRVLEVGADLPRRVLSLVGQKIELDSWLNRFRRWACVQ